MSTYFLHLILEPVQVCTNVMAALTDAESTCPHISNLLNDTSSGETTLQKYISVASWNASHSQLVRPAKRRKVGLSKTFVFGGHHL